MGSPELRSIVYELLTTVEELYEHSGYHGSTDKFFSLVEKCADKRPVRTPPLLSFLSYTSPLLPLLLLSSPSSLTPLLSFLSPALPQFLLSSVSQSLHLSSFCLPSVFLLSSPLFHVGCVCPHPDLLPGPVHPASKGRLDPEPAQAHGEVLQVHTHTYHTHTHIPHTHTHVQHTHILSDRGLRLIICVSQE